MGNRSGATVRRWATALLVAGMGLVGSASATLIDRGGGLIYDDVLNIIWLQDANYAQTSGFDADGRMNWFDANAWAAGLSYFDSVRNVTWTDWRLAAINLTSPTTIAHNCSSGGAAACAASGNELGYMYYFDLDGVGNNTGNQTSVLGGVTLNNIQPFYWSGTQLNPSIDHWAFFFVNAFQGFQNTPNPLSAWAVRPGDVGAAVVPEPASLLLIGVGVMGLALMRRRARRR